MCVVQVVFLVLFALFVRYHPDADSKFHPASNNATIQEAKKEHYELGEPEVYPHQKTYPMFQDVHVMIFIGFGFLMTFLKRYGFSSVGLNFMIASLSLQWAILMNGFFHLHHGIIQVDLMSLLSADFVAATVLISFGAVLGKTNPTQLIIMTLIEIPIFVINEVIGRSYLGAVDMGDSMFVHAFGAYFGLAVSLALKRDDQSTDKEGSSKNSDTFAMIGTVFLWLYWPSFNGGAATGDDQHRAIINTYISLAFCCCTAFAISCLINEEKKFDMVHIQNSTLAGGVAIGTAADMMVQPWGAALTGIVAGVLSVVGYEFITPAIHRVLKIHDTCGVHNLHGMPAVLAGVIGAIMAALANEETYGYGLYQIFPNRAPQDGTEELAAIVATGHPLEAGPGWTASYQAGMQFLALILSMVFAIVGGVLTGFVMRLGIWNDMTTPELYEDIKYWKVEDEEEGHGDIPMEAGNGKA